LIISTGRSSAGMAFVSTVDGRNGRITEWGQTAEQRLHCRHLFEFHEGAISRGPSSPSTSPQAGKYRRCCSGTQRLKSEQRSFEISDRKRPSWTRGSDAFTP
jgi:hypothetical protein